MGPKVSVSLTKKHYLFIQENVHASKSFWEIYPLKSYILCDCAFIITKYYKK